MIATVVKTEERQGKNGNGPYWAIYLAGQERPLYCFDKKLGPSLQPGLAYELEVDQSGRFPKVKGARPIASANGPQPSQQAQGDAQEREKALELCLRAVAYIRPQDIPALVEAARCVLAYLKGEPFEPEF